MNNTFENPNDSAEEREAAASAEEESTFDIFTAVHDTKPQDTKKKRLSKGTKALLGSVGVLAVLGGGLAALKLTEPDEKPDDNSSAVTNEAVSLWKADSDAISRIEVEKENGERYAANRKIEEQKTTDADGLETVIEVENYYLEGYEDIPMNTVDIRTLATRCASLTSIDVVQKDTPESDLAKYGLDQPIRVTLSVDEQDDICFLLGDISPVKDYSYLQVEGDSTVYTVSSGSVEPYRADMLSYLGTTVTPEQADDDKTIVESVRIERADLDYDFYFEFDEFFLKHNNGGSSAVHVMVEPIPCLLNAENAAPATHGLYGLTAAEVLYPHPTEAQLAECGLGDEEASVTVTMKTDDGKTTVFRMGKSYVKKGNAEIGESDTTCYYGYIDTVDCIYGFAADTVIYEDMKPSTVTSMIVVDTYVWDIGKLVYKAGDLKLDFDCIGTTKQDFVVTRDGEPVETERFRLLYSYLLKTAAEDLILEEIVPEGDPLASIQLKRQDGKRETNVAFYDAGGLKAYIAVNGVVRFKCRMAYVNTLISNMQIFDTDQDFTMSW